MKAIELKKDYRFKFERENQLIFFLYSCEENCCDISRYSLEKSTAWIAKDCGLSFNALLKLAKQAEKKELKERFNIRQIKPGEYKLTFSSMEKVKKFAKLAKKEFGEFIEISTSAYNPSLKRHAAWVILSSKNDEIEAEEQKLFDLAFLADMENFD